MNGCKTCDKLIYDRSVILGCRRDAVDFGDQLKMAEKRLVAHNLIKHFDHVVDLMCPPTPEGPLKALIEALEGKTPRADAVRTLEGYRTQLIKELGL